MQASRARLYSSNAGLSNDRRHRGVEAEGADVVDDLGAGVVFAGSTAFLVLLVAATLGVLSPSGSEVGPFLPIEQASLTYCSG